KPPNAGSDDLFPRGHTAVTPVLTLSPEISVRCPTSTPETSVIAFLGPGVPSRGTPRSRARGLFCATKPVASRSESTSFIVASGGRVEGLPCLSVPLNAVIARYRAGLRRRIDPEVRPGSRHPGVAFDHRFVDLHAEAGSAWNHQVAAFDFERVLENL